jgi:hypothetical protein
MIMESDMLPAAELLPPNPIRVETALSRYPVHRLAKHGEIAIDIRETTEGGQVAIRWEVTHNSKFGQPGPLAYKLDTLLINRRIERAERPIPRIIRLGSTREIIIEIGLTNHDTQTLKKAFRQNASAFITAVIQYRQNDGTTRTLEADFTRYSVVFTGEELPDGRKADAVYTVLNDIYMQVLNGAMTRPLDYDYLRGLPPAPQRFYELLSYRMYAAIKNDRPRAKLLYSELCTYAPQTRYFDWDHARKQMAKIHRPHRQSGYIAKADYEQTVDGGGRPDWIMLYQPGPKARAEYRAFNRRGGPVMLEAEPFDPEPLPQLSGPEPSPLEAELIGRGVTPGVAAALVRDHGEEKVRAQGEILDWYLAKKPGKIDDPAAWLVAAIKSPTGHAVPKGFVSKAERDRREEDKRKADRRAAKDRRRKRAEAAEYWASLTAEGRAEVDAASMAAADPASLAAETGPFKGTMQRIRREQHIRRLLADRERS